MDVDITCCYPRHVAYLPNTDVAKDDFSIITLVQDCVACLGGPDFNPTVAKQRLIDKQIFVPSRDPDINDKQHSPTSMIVPWCSRDYYGWSEQILLNKIQISRLEHRWVPAGTNLFRPHGPDCQPIQPSFISGWAKHYASPLPLLVCLMVHEKVAYSQDGEAVWQTIQNVQPFRIRKRGNSSTCLSLNSTSGNVDSRSCIEHPIEMRQVFSSHSDNSNLHSLWDETNKVDVNFSWNTL